MNKPKILHLALKGEYFDAIKSGKKRIAYRKCSDYWVKRLWDNKTKNERQYDFVHVTRGYPNKNDTEKHLWFRYNGWYHQILQRKEFGPDEVLVYAIRLTSPITEM